MTEAERIAGIVGAALPHVKRGSLCFWGSWLGKPYDNMHEVVRCEAQGDLLTFYFEDDEILKVWAPRAVSINADTFRIGDADRVRWEWFYYGRPKVPANLYFEDITAERPEIRTETNVDWYVPNFQTNRSLPAVEML